MPLGYDKSLLLWSRNKFYYGFFSGCKGHSLSTSSYYVLAGDSQVKEGGIAVGDNDSKECCQSKESERRLNNIDETLKDYGARLGEVETRTVIYNEQIKVIFNMLQDIKQSLKELQKTVDEVEKRPADLSSRIFIGVMTSVITALIMLGLRFLQ
jgi:hypothetical protein